MNNAAKNFNILVTDWKF